MTEATAAKSKLTYEKAEEIVYGVTDGADHDSASSLERDIRQALDRSGYPYQGVSIADDMSSVTVFDGDGHGLDPIAIYR